MQKALLFLTLLLAACGTTIRVPNLGQIYESVAEIQGTQRQILITIPGVLGSQLLDSQTGDILWGDGFSLIANVNDPTVLEKLALPFSNSATPNHELEDEVTAGDILRQTTARLFGLPVEVEVYSGIVSTIGTGGWIPEADITQEDLRNGTRPTSYKFPYDWRLDMGKIINEFDIFVKERFANRPADQSGGMDLMAHSMGSLIGRYYLMYGNQPLPRDGSLPVLNWAGAKYFRNAVFIAPPNAGSVTAFSDLVNGSPLGPLQPTLRAELTGSIFSTYLLMPRTRHKRVVYGDTDEPIDLYDPALWQKYGWGLAADDATPYLRAVMPDAADDAERRARALRFQADALARAEQFQRALDRPETALPDGLTVYLVVGGSHQTPAKATVTRTTGAVAVTEFEEGDGVVLRVSSLLDERQGNPDKLALATPLAYSTVLFLPEEHTELTKSPVFGDNLLFWLLQSTRDPEFLRQAGRTQIIRPREEELRPSDLR